MGRRNEPRETRAESIKIYGKDDGGHAFSQSAHTVDISACGLHVRDIYCVHNIDCSLLIEHKGRRARYRVMWVGSPGTELDGHLGLECNERDKNIFHISPTLDRYVDGFHEADAPPPQSTVAAPSSSKASASTPKEVAGERRRAPRYSCSGTAEIRDVKTPVALSGRLADISLGGCYLEMMNPLPVGAVIELAGEVGGTNFRTPGIVKTSFPAMGMGVEFGKLNPSDRAQLQRIIGQLSGAPVAPVSPPQPVAPTVKPEQALSAMTPNAPASNAVLLDQILFWFVTNDVLTRKDLQRLMHQTPGDLSSMPDKPLLTVH